MNSPLLPYVQSVDCTDEQRRAVFMAASILLDYPGEDFSDRLEAVREALPDMPDVIADQFAEFADWAGEQPIFDLASHFVETFDQRRRCALWLSYYAVGDTRQRGAAILGFKYAMRDAGWEMERDELPDYLPVVLEFAAYDQGDTAVNLLSSHREGLEVLRSALLSANSPYHHIVAAVCAALPEIDMETAQRFQKLITQGPPAELVGITDTSTGMAPFSLTGTD